MPKRFKRNCDYCGNFYFGEGIKFCSRECADEDKRHQFSVRPKLKRNCFKCGIEFLVKLKKQIYCSHKCYSDSRKRHKNRYEFKKHKVPTDKYCNIRNRALKKKWDCCQREDFINWYTAQEKKCFYCGIPFEVWEMLYRGHQNKYALTVDRKDNSLGYIVPNLVMACSQCNSVKNDTLSSQDMQKIGVEYIRPKWIKKYQEVTNNAFCA